jgi:hypothetical protein
MIVSDLTGGCLCEAVRFAYSGELGGKLGKITLCVCTQCRKAQGFGSGVAPAAREGFCITRGAEHVKEFESSPGKHRAFCGLCGSPLYSRRDQAPGALRLRLGALDSSPMGLKVEAVIHARGAPAWTEAEGAPRHPGVEPDRP